MEGTGSASRRRQTKVGHHLCPIVGKASRPCWIAALLACRRRLFSVKTGKKRLLVGDECRELLGATSLALSIFLSLFSLFCFSCSLSPLRVIDEQREERDRMPSVQSPEISVSGLILAPTEPIHLLSSLISRPNLSYNDRLG